MKHFLILFAFLLLGNRIYAISAAPNVTLEVLEKKAERLAFKEKMTHKFTKIKQNAKTFVAKSPFRHEEDDKFLLSVLLAIFVGGFGIHRIYLGAKPIIILKYILLNLLFGFGIILSIIDLVVMLMDSNTSRFNGNNKLFASLNDGRPS